MIRTVLATALALVCVTSIAEARSRTQPVCDNADIMRPCAYQPNFLEGVRSIRVEMHRATPVKRSSDPGDPRARPSALDENGTGIVPHPPGCPARLFCGCGAAVRVFGAPIRALWLAAAWFKFPRAEPAAGMVAVRSHHVFVLESHIAGNVWRAYDANSGGGATRIHARSIAGYTIVNPHGAG